MNNNMNLVYTCMCTYRYLVYFRSFCCIKCWWQMM